MNNIRKKLIGLILLIIIISILVYVSSAQGNETNITLQEKNEIAKKSQNVVFNESLQKSDVDITVQANRNIDRSLNILNIVATLISVLVALLTLIIVFVGSLGFYQISKWRKISKDIYEESKTFITIREKAENELITMRKEYEKINILPFDEKPSEVKRKELDEFSSRLSFLEMLGASLTTEDYYNRANDFYYKNEFELSLMAFEKAIENDPTFVEAWGGKGRALANLGRYHEAIKANEKAIELDPNIVYNWSNNAGNLLSLGRLDEGREFANKAIEISPDYPGGWYNLACYYSIKGDKENMLSNLRKSFELDDSYIEKAKKDKDFEKFWEDNDFRELFE